jgi:hypothetical protein
MFILEALPAHKGDCLLLRYGTKSTPKVVVIDGGPADVYRPSLQPALAQLRIDRGLADSQPLPIELMVVSHIDDDHIVGILELTGEMAEARENHAPAPYRVADLWHNTFDDLIGSTPDELQASISARFGAASTSDAVLAKNPALTLDAAKILASVGQGRRLRDDIKKLQIPHNAAFDGALAMLGASGPRKTRKMGGGLELTVVGPMKAQLEKLQKEHDNWLKQQKKSRKDPEAALAAFIDGSAPNLSSIVIHATSGKKSMLLTGDARGDFIMMGLVTAGLMTKTRPYVVDVLKVPHHGSDNNVEQAFFEKVRATHYVFSGDGQHGNPERATLEMLFAARESVPALKSKPFFLHFTYPIDEIDRNRKIEWEKQLAKGRKTRKWSPTKDGLEALMDDSNDGELRFEVDDNGEGVRVALAE